MSSEDVDDRRWALELCGRSTGLMPRPPSPAPPPSTFAAPTAQLARAMGTTCRGAGGGGNTQTKSFAPRVTNAHATAAAGTRATKQGLFISTAAVARGATYPGGCRLFRFVGSGVDVRGGAGVEASHGAAAASTTATSCSDTLAVQSWHRRSVCVAHGRHQARRKRLCKPLSQYRAPSTRRDVSSAAVREPAVRGEDPRARVRAAC